MRLWIHGITMFGHSQTFGVFCFATTTNKTIISVKCIKSRNPLLLVRWGGWRPSEAAAGHHVRVGGEGHAPYILQLMQHRPRPFCKFDLFCKFSLCSCKPSNGKAAKLFIDDQWLISVFSVLLVLAVASHPSEN